MKGFWKVFVIVIDLVTLACHEILCLQVSNLQDTVSDLSPLDFLDSLTYFDRNCNLRVSVRAGMFEGRDFGEPEPEIAKVRP